MHHRPLVFLDIETTGASAATSRITEIGAVRVEDHQIVATFNQLINPEEPVPAFITRLTGITDNMLRDAPLFMELIPPLQDAIFVAHNVNFDYSFMQAEHRRAGQQFAMDRICTVRLSRRLYPDQPRHNLDTILKRHNIAVQNRHRALDDATALCAFFNIAYAEHQTNLFAAMNNILVRTR